MPGTILVSVLELLGLPFPSSPSSISIKVSMGNREYQALDKGEFSFPLTTLRENLVIVVKDSNGNEISHGGVETKSIVERGIWDEIFTLEGGGQVHMKLQFVLNEDEKNRIRKMREAALKRKQGRLITFRPKNVESSVYDGGSKFSASVYPENAVSRGLNSATGNLRLTTMTEIDKIAERATRDESSVVSTSTDTKDVLGSSRIVDKKFEERTTRDDSSVVISSAEVKEVTSLSLVEVKKIEERTKHYDSSMVSSSGQAKEVTSSILAHADVIKNEAKTTKDDSSVVRNSADAKEVTGLSHVEVQRIEESTRRDDNVMVSNFAEPKDDMGSSQVELKNTEERITRDDSSVGSNSAGPNEVTGSSQVEIKRLEEKTTTDKEVTSTSLVEAEKIKERTTIDHISAHAENTSGSSHFEVKKNKERTTSVVPSGQNPDTQIETGKVGPRELIRKAEARPVYALTPSKAVYSKQSPSSATSSESGYISRKRPSLERSPSSVKRMISAFESSVSQETRPQIKPRLEKQQVNKTDLYSKETESQSVDPMHLKESRKTNVKVIDNKPREDLTKNPSVETSLVSKNSLDQQEKKLSEDAFRAKQDVLSESLKIPIAERTSINHKSKMMDKYHEDTVDCFEVSGSWIFPDQGRLFCATTGGKKVMDFMSVHGVEPEIPQEKTIVCVPQKISDEDENQNEMKRSEEITELKKLKQQNDGSQSATGLFGKVVKVAIMIGFGVLVIFTRQRNSR